MKTKLIQLPDYNIIISDEEPKKGDKSCWCINSIKKTWEDDIILYQGGMPMYHYIGFKKLIASDNPEHNLPSIDYNDFEEKFGIVNVEKIAEEVIKTKGTIYKDAILGKSKFIEGFKKAQSLNEKKFSLDDILSFVQNEDNHTEGELGNSCIDVQTIVNYFTTQQPKVFNIKVEMEQINNKHNSPSYAVKTQYKPKITNNKTKL